MKLNYSLNLNKNKDAVLEAFCDPGHYEKHQGLIGSMNYEEIEHSDDGTKFSIKFRFEVESDVPAFAKKILGDRSEVIQVESWNRETGEGRISVDVKTLPGTIEGTARLEDDGDGCTKTFDWEVKVKIPLVGGKIEKVVADDIRSKAGPDQDAVNQLLGS